MTVTDQPAVRASAVAPPRPARATAMEPAPIPPDRRVSPLRSRVAALRATVAGLDRRLADPHLPLALTLLLVLLGTSQSWYVAVPVVVLAVVGLIQPRATDRPMFWSALAATLGAAAWAGRWQVDNHQFLIAYWCFALALAAASPAPASVRRVAARVLIAAVFVLAVVWKATSPDFVDGSFMRYTLLTDVRFTEVATLIGGVGPNELAENRAMVEGLGRPDAVLGPVALHGSSRMDVLADAVTYWTLLIEGAVALAFALPWRRLARWRDALLITFIVTTYAIAPVVGFGWVLVCLGLAQHERDRRGIRLAYVAAFLLVQAFTAPWTSIAGLMP